MATFTCIWLLHICYIPFKSSASVLRAKYPRLSVSILTWDVDDLTINMECASAMRDLFLTLQDSVGNKLIMI